MATSTHLIVGRIRPFLIAVPHHKMLPPIQTSDLMPRELPEDETLCPITLSSHPSDSIGVDVFTEGVVAIVVKDGLWHGVVGGW